MKKPFYKQIWAKIVASITFIGILLGIITQGFQVWDKFKISTSSKSPIIDIRVDPFERNYGDTSNYQYGKTFFTIQTSNGSYQILDSILFEKFIVLRPDYFVETEQKPNSILSDVIIDNMILDYRIPSEIGMLKFKNNFILRGDKTTELINSKQKIKIGIIILSIPYKYENEIYHIKKEIPILVYYEEKK
ncbi:MAG: hypothetical protein PHN88_03565 [Ignavibacteria bacterium]|nr:hypothetical protein [Ignavibacteria bacterium]